MEYKSAVIADFTFDFDVSAMEKNNGADNVKSKSHTLFVDASGFVSFVEFIKDKADILVGDTLAAVFDKDKCAIVLMLESESDISVGICELYRILYKVVEYLMYKVIVTVCGDIIFVIQTLDADFLFFDFIFKIEQYIESGVLNYKRRFFDIYFSAVDF